MKDSIMTLYQFPDPYTPQTSVREGGRLPRTRRGKVLSTVGML